MTPPAAKRDLIDPTKIEIAQPRPVQELAVDYARVSSKPQDKMSLETQHDENGAYAVRQNLRIVRSFEDVGSGLSTRERPQFLEMVEFVLDKRNGIRHVIFFDLDRFTRRNRDFHVYTEELEQEGIYLHSVAENQVYSQNSALSWHVKLWIGEGSSRSNAFHTKRGQRGAVRNGDYMGTKPPYGHEIYYMDEIEKKHPRLKEHPYEWPHLLKILDMGLNNETPLTIVRYLRDAGIPGPTGEDWTEEAVRFILQNEHNTGYTFRGKHPKSKLPGRPEELPVQYSEKRSHKAAITVPDYHKLQNLIAARAVSRGPTRSHSSPHIFSNIAKCGECKQPNKLHNLTVIRDEGYEPRLRCVKKKNQGAETCPKENIPMLWFQDLVFNRMINYIFTEENLERQVEAAAQNTRKFLKEEEADRKAFQVRLKKIDKELRNCNGTVRQYGTKYLKIDSLMKTIDRLERERAALTAEMQRHEENIKEAELFIKDPKGIIATLLDYKTYTESEDPKSVKELAKLFIERIEVFNDHIDIYYHLTPQLESLKDSLRKETISLKGNGPSNRKKIRLLEGLMGICTALNRGATAVSRFTSSHRARASWVSTSSSPLPAVVESIAALRFDCQSSSIRGLAPEGSRNCADSRLRAQARSRWSIPAYLPNITRDRSPPNCCNRDCFSPCRRVSCNFASCEPIRSTSSRNGGISAFIRCS